MGCVDWRRTLTLNTESPAAKEGRLRGNRAPQEYLSAQYFTLTYSIDSRLETMSIAHWDITIMFVSFLVLNYIPFTY